MKRYVFLMACALAVAPLSAQESQSEDLLPEWTFTTGIEGAAHDAQGNIYACNYKEQGTIGILRDGQAELFGKLVAPHLGSARFLILYLIGVVSGNLLFLLFNWNSTVPTYLFGASGAVCAIMAAAAMLEPRRQFVLIFMPFFPLRTPTLVVSYTVLEILLQLSGSQSGVAHLAHLGGFLGGYLYLKILFGARLPWDPFRRRVRPGDWKQPPSWGGESNSRPEPAPGEGPVSSHELDALLDKISRNGINSLTAHELARLRRAREEMRGNQWR